MFDREKHEYLPRNADRDKTSQMRQRAWWQRKQVEAEAQKKLLQDLQTTNDAFARMNVQLQNFINQQQWIIRDLETRLMEREKAQQDTEKVCHQFQQQIQTHKERNHLIDSEAHQETQVMQNFPQQLSFHTSRSLLPPSKCASVAKWVTRLDLDSETPHPFGSGSPMDRENS